MTAVYFVEKKAADLRLGDMFLSWFVTWDKKKEAIPKRILNIKEKKGKLEISFDDTSKATLHPEHIVLVQEIA